MSRLAGGDEGLFTRRNLVRVALALSVFFLVAALLVFLGVYPPGRGSSDSAPLPAGDAGSPPTLTEFADFNCPYCRRFAALIMPELRRRFIDPGLVAYEYRHMPFLAQSSYDAAEMAECARLQGRFREFHDAVYAVEPSGFLTASDLDAAARDSGVDLALLGECRSSGEGRMRVEADVALADASGVRGTPTLFLDGRLLSWSGYDELERLIEDALD